MKKLCIISLILMAILLENLSMGAKKTDVGIFVDVANKAVLGDGKISVPVDIANLTSMKAFSLIVKYTGTVDSLEFVPTKFLHEPLVIPPRIDLNRKKISIFVTATNKIVTREASGTLGYIVLGKNSNLEAIEIVEASFVDEEYQINEIIAADVQSASSRIEERKAWDKRDSHETKLYQSYPNPANPITTISFSVKEEVHTTLKIYNVNGQLIRTLVDRGLPPGKYDVEWNALDEIGNPVASGIYFCRFTSGDYSSTKKMIIIK